MSNNDFNSEEYITKLIENTSLEDDLTQELNLDEIIKYTTLQIENIKKQKEENEEDSTLNNNNNKVNTIEPNENTSKCIIDNDELERILKEADELTLRKTNSFENNNINSVPQIKEYFPNLDIQVNTQKKIKQIYPLEFISNYKELNYKNNFLLNLIGSNLTYILSEYEQKNNINSNFLDCSILKELTHYIQRNNTTITCIHESNGILFVGNKEGEIKSYSIKDKFQIKNYISNEIKNEMNKDVMCISTCYTMEFLVAGYENGTVILWDIEKAKIKKLVYDEENSPILNLKFLKYTNTESRILSSNLDGLVKLLSIKDGFFSIGVTESKILSNECPSVLIETINFNINQIKEYGLENKLNTYNNIALIGNVESIEIYLIDNDNILSAMTISTPSLFTEIPSASFGYGLTPYYFENNAETNNVIDNEGLNFSKSQLLLAISWNISIALYVIPIIQNVIQRPLQVGHFEANNSIINIGFLSNSILYFINNDKIINSINTSTFEKGSYEQEDNNFLGLNLKKIKKKNSLKNNQKKGKKIDDISDIYLDLCCQYFNVDPKKKDTTKFYNNLICCNHKDLYALGNQGLYHCKIQDYIECLDRLQKNKNWEKLFCIGIKIYDGKINGLANIPPKEEHRKARLKAFLKQKSIEYLKGLFESDSNINKDEDDDDYIYILIELYLNIEDVGFLIKDIGEILTKYNKSDLFFETLEPFILKNKFIDQIFYNNDINPLINNYINKSKTFILSQLIPHFNIESVNQEYIKNVCLDYNLFNALFYLFMNSKLDPFELIPKLFKEFKQSNINLIDEKAEKINDLGNVNFYNNSLIEKLGHEKFEHTRDFIGHQLFWYINLCILGKKYPSNNDIDFSIHHNLIQKIFLWYISYDVISVLAFFDSYTYFYLLNNFFSEKKTIAMIMSISLNTFSNVVNKYNINLVSQINNKVPIKEPNMKLYFRMIDEISNTFPRIWILQDYYQFIITISLKIDIDEDLTIKAVNNIINYYKFLNTSNKNISLYDKYKCHYKIIAYDKSYIEDISEILIDIIDQINNNKNDNNAKQVEQYFETFLANSELSPFTSVKIHLLYIKKEYIRCINTYLNPHIGESIDINIFNFINSTFTDLKENNYEEFQKVKDYLLDKFAILANISIEEILKLVTEWYKDDKDLLIHKLDSVPKLQLKYIEIQLDRYKNMDEISIDDASYTKLLFMQIKLLIDLDRKHQIIIKLKERPNSYPLNECLDLCIKNQIYDAAVYIYQLLGQNKNALDLSINEIIRTFEKAKKNACDDINFNKKEYEIELEDLSNNINNCISICESSQCNGLDIPEDVEDLWFCLLDSLYGIFERIEKIKPSSHINDIKKFISEKIKKLLKEMCCYISLQKLIAKVTEQYTSGEFKDLFKKMINSFGHLEKVLMKSKLLLAGTIIRSFDENLKISKKGEKYKFKYCHFCNEMFDRYSNQPIFFFKCKHVLHEKCTIYEDDMYLCQVCRKNDVEFQIINPKRKNNKIPINNSNINTSNKLYDVNKINTINNDDNMFNNLYHKNNDSEKIKKEIDEQNKRRAKVRINRKLDILQNKYFKLDSLLDEVDGFDIN